MDVSSLDSFVYTPAEEVEISMRKDYFSRQLGCKLISTIKKLPGNIASLSAHNLQCSQIATVVTNVDLMQNCAVMLLLGNTAAGSPGFNQIPWQWNERCRSV